MKNVKLRCRTCLADEHLEACMQITATKIKPHIEKMQRREQLIDKLSND
jgi:hypothetical protein